MLRNVLEQKCAYKAIALPTVESLLPHRADLEGMWRSMLGHQLPILPPIEDSWEALPELLDWIMSDAERPRCTRIRPDGGETIIRTRVLPMSVPVRARPALEIIRFAAGNHLCVDLTYDKGVRRIEPHSLRETADGNYVLHAVRSDSGEHRSYRVDRIQKAEVTAQAFAPRYVIELTVEGPLPVVPSARRSLRRRRDCPHLPRRSRDLHRPLAHRPAQRPLQPTPERHDLPVAGSCRAASAGRLP